MKEPFTTENLHDTAEKFWGSAIAADFSVLEGKSLAAKMVQDRGYARESLVLCDLYWPVMHSPGLRGGAPELESRVYATITGKEMDEAGLNAVGERIFNLQRAILLREGWKGRRDDRILDYFHTEPLKKGEVFHDPDSLVPGREGEVISNVGKVVERDDFERLKDEYYELRGWDVDSGLPRKEKLTALGLEDVASDLERRGLLK